MIRVFQISLRKPKVFVSHILRHYLTKECHVQKFFYCLIRLKKPCIRKFEGSTHSKILGILQTEIFPPYIMCVQYHGVLITMKDIMSTLGDVQYRGRYHDKCGGIS